MLIEFFILYKEVFEMDIEEATLECVTVSENVNSSSCHTDCGPFWDDDDNY